MIRFILDHTQRKRDVNGNTYWLTRYTSTKTARSILVETAHPSNARCLLRGEDSMWPNYHQTERIYPAREWDRMAKRVDISPAATEAEICEAVYALEESPNPRKYGPTVPSGMEKS